VDGTNYFAVILADDAVKAEQIGQPQPLSKNGRGDS
jgi:hypothetical protein